MIRYLAYAIGVSQLLGGLYAFSYFDSVMATTASAAPGATYNFWLLVSIVIYLAGLVGAMLLFSSFRAGYTLSVLHQIVLIPIFVLAAQPAITANGETTAGSEAFQYAVEDAASFAVVVYRNETVVEAVDGTEAVGTTQSVVSLTKSSQSGVTALFTLGDSTIISQLNPQPGFNYYGLNVLALLSAIILVIAQRQLVAGRSEG